MNCTIRVPVTVAETTLDVSLAVIDCAVCGLIFAIPDEYRGHRHDDGQTFWCPNGHPLSFTPSETNLLRRKLRETERDRDWFREAEKSEREQRYAAERSAAAYRGQVTRLRKRAASGVCAFCHRHFTNVERHVATKHPEEQG